MALNSASVSFNSKDLEDFKKVQAETENKQIQDKIKFLEARGYRVVLNNTGSNDERNERMIKVLESVGYKIKKG